MFDNWWLLDMTYVQYSVSTIKTPQASLGLTCS